MTITREIRESSVTNNDSHTAGSILQNINPVQKKPRPKADHVSFLNGNEPTDNAEGMRRASSNSLDSSYVNHLILSPPEDPEDPIDKEKCCMKFCRNIIDRYK